jgi:isopentenyldiphosphate isomerase
MSEQLEIVCEQTGTPLGYSLPRHEAIAQGAWCQSTNVYVVNSAGQILCHQRSLQKERLPGGWSTHLGGHVGAGEYFLSNAQKELEEEAGVALAEHAFLPWRTSKLTRARLWVMDVVVHHDAPLDAFTPQPGEVETFAWMHPQEIMSAYAQAPETWFAGTHHFPEDYACIRAVLAAAHHKGMIRPTHDIRRWHPLSAAMSA